MTIWASVGLYIGIMWNISCLVVLLWIFLNCSWRMELTNLKSRKNRNQNEFQQPLLTDDQDLSGASESSVESSLDNNTTADQLSKKPNRQQKTAKRNNWTLVERAIEPGDTVQKLSLLYGIKVSDLKKANGLVSDQDFFSLQTVKIPVKKYSLASDLLETSDRQQQVLQVPLQPSMKPTYPQDSVPLIPLVQKSVMLSDWDCLDDSEEVFHPTHSGNTGEEPKSCEDILKGVDKSLAKAKDFHNSLLEKSQEEQDGNTSDADADMRHMPNFISRRANNLYLSIRNFFLLIALPAGFLILVLTVAVYLTRRNGDNTHYSPVSSKNPSNL